MKLKFNKGEEFALSFQTLCCLGEWFCTQRSQDEPCQLE